MRPPAVEAMVRDMAVQAFRALGCDGMARVDFCLTPDMRAFVSARRLSGRFIKQTVDKKRADPPTS